MRRISGGTVSLHSQADAHSEPDTYTDRLTKLIPAESIAVYTFINIILDKSELSFIFDWFVFSAVVVGNWFYLKKTDSQVKWKQQFIMCISFIVFSMANGTVFERTFDGYDTTYGAVLVPLVVFLFPLFNNETFDSP